MCAADSEEEANLLRTSSLQSFVNLRRGVPGKLPPPIANYEDTLNEAEQSMLNSMSRCAAVGTKETVSKQIHSFVDETNVDELIVVCSIYDHAARLRSYEITAEIAQSF